jgi:hypothetical protein
MGSVSTYIQHQISVIVTISGDVNRHSSSFKMATVLKEWFNNKCSCLSGKSKETKGGYSAQETRIVDQMTRSSFERQCLTSQCCRNCESLQILGLGNTSTSTIQTWFDIVGLPSIPKDGKVPQRSKLPLQWRRSKWSQEMFAFQDAFFFL